MIVEIALNLIELQGSLGNLVLYSRCESRGLTSPSPNEVEPRPVRVANVWPLQSSNAFYAPLAMIPSEHNSQPDCLLIVIERNKLVGRAGISHAEA
jgi:hypothetical protein